jgi:hypothetical protein
VSWTVSSISDSMVGDCAITSPQNVLTLSNVRMVVASSRRLLVLGKLKTHRGAVETRCPQ